MIRFPGSAQAWSLLRAGVPLSLLCDLADPEGPASREILTAEAVPEDVAIDLASMETSSRRVVELPEVSVRGA